MKIKPTSLSAILTLFAVSSANAVITVTFNRAFAGGVSEGLADSAGTPTDGLVYGLLIDTAGDGFLSQYDSGFNLDRGGLISLTAGGSATADQLFISAGISDSFLTSDTGAFAEDGGFTVTGGTGGVSGLGDIPDSAAGDSFALLWFDSSQSADANVDEGTRFGILNHPTFVIPGAGQTVTLDESFIGDDPIRPATSGAFAIPEPSGFSLLVLSVASFAFRRRRRM